MTSTAEDYARTQADGADNIAPTLMQGQQAWQYAQSDNFFSPEERAAVMRRELEPYRAQIEAKLMEVGYPLSKHSGVENALFSGRQTDLLHVNLSPESHLVGSLRIVMTEDGPDVRITPAQPTLTIPTVISGIQLSKAEQQQLNQEKALPRPFLIPVDGEYVPTFLRVDAKTNTVELWQVKSEELPIKLMGIDLTRDQQMQLAHGHAVRLNGLMDNQGEPFNATVSISAATQALQFADLSRLDVSVKPGQEFKNQLAQNNEGAKTDIVQSQEKLAGLPGISHQQSEDIKKLLEMEPSQREQGQRVKL